MNSYNENLQNTVAATLQSQNLDLKGLKSQKKAAMYTLYYAEGATITTEEKLDAAANDLLLHKTPAKQEAVKNTSISANQLNSSTQANQYTGQSVSNVATCASNVQIAATGITRLAGDIGSIFSIVNAADFGTDIYTLTETVNELINTTAFNAEFTSQIAMQASAATSEVSASTVLNDAKATNALINNVLQVASADFNTASQLVTSDNATLATATSTEKLAEGAFESADIDYLTGLSAYESVNLGLNLGLTSIALSSKSFFVFFDRIKTPFPSPPDITPIVIPGEKWYPVSDYYIFVVKDNKKLTFSISEAENLRINGKDQYVKMHRHIIAPPASEIMLPDDMIGEVIDYTKVVVPDRNPYALLDSDGDPVAAGSNYVVFIMVVYTDVYKRVINNFNDFLSAPSLPFCMTTLLNAASNIEIYPVAEFSVVAAKGKKNMLTKMITAGIDPSSIVSHSSDAKYVLVFEAVAPTDTKATMACECMFLPVTIQVSESLSTRSSFDTYIDDQLKTDKIKLQNVLEIINQTIGKLNARLKLAKEGGADETNKAIKPGTAEIEQYIALLKAKQAELTDPDKTTQTTFFFNKALAEIVPAGSSTTATQWIIPGDEPKKTAPIATGIWYAFIGPATTDNFGNLLMSTVSYVPAILSYIFSDDEKTVSKYTSNISDYETYTPPFSY
jgi:hypothetical protein